MKKEMMGVCQDRLNRFFISLSALVALGTKSAGRVSRKFKLEMTHSRIALRSSFSSFPKKLLTNINNKAISFRLKKRTHEESKAKDEEEVDERFGDGGLWQRTILMGDKCRPPEFSGAIYYDSNGRQLSEPAAARSPLASPLPYFSSQVAGDNKY